MRSEVDESPMELQHGRVLCYHRDCMSGISLSYRDDVHCEVTREGHPVKRHVVEEPLDLWAHFVVYTKARYRIPLVVFFVLRFVGVGAREITSVLVLGVSQLNFQRNKFKTTAQIS